ncbi:MAG TPA: dTDP-4-dehydrorhamnose 3,5-epimerase [Pirellulales bacterium]|jgi:dTDP-4-dehydrorhamnose 3,5-epimerase|nr:dTDP-4-dehydrorhamnose 3,5-epimerase [Pirellulales bacterium]
MLFLPTNIAGLLILQLEKLSDERGYFARQWCQRELEQHGLDGRCAQINTAFSPLRGTLRGLHFQLAPKAEVKIVRCPRGALFDVAVDLRADSPTCGQWYGLELTPENGRMLYIPEGMAHGFQTLRPNTEMSYQASEFFSAAHARGIRYNDPQFAIDWPLPVHCISEKDRDCPDWMPSWTVAGRR